MNIKCNSMKSNLTHVSGLCITPFRHSLINHAYIKVVIIERSLVNAFISYIYSIRVFCHCTVSSCYFLGILFSEKPSHLKKDCPQSMLYVFRSCWSLISYFCSCTITSTICFYLLLYLCFGVYRHHFLDFLYFWLLVSSSS